MESSEPVSDHREPGALTLHCSVSETTWGLPLLLPVEERGGKGSSVAGWEEQLLTACTGSARSHGGAASALNALGCLRRWRAGN